MMINIYNYFIEKISELGAWCIQCTRSCGVAILMLGEAILNFRKIPKRRNQIGILLYTVGIRSFGVTSVVALFTGMILSLQAGLELRKFGQEVNVGVIVSQTMCREMGPFMTALILAASVGSMMAAELGTMKVSEELDALEVMGISTNEFLIMPRVLAMLIMTPILTIYTNLIGTIGGGLVANTQLHLNWLSYFNNVLTLLHMKEIYFGLFKAAIFGLQVSAISCFQGITTTNGAIGVGKATRESVVLSFLYVLITGYMLTRIFYD